ncbi:hypothetical protein FHR20_003026 [Sphingomonas leidyi]|uniref:Uncharacterized protein n=1 Tax=Sphingomonas leidyi TaxID=68569 RepID=A0A7X5V197_9SPHN|nr:hypothetical protein [Sphingomonas leidyi]NIJ66064.1 hypothetical protein [Sphingomonas leidyi]
MRRSFLGGLGALLGAARVKAREQDKALLPPVPAWHPSFATPLDRIADRVRYYLDGKRDFALFRHGTFAILADGLSDEAARAAARTALAGVFCAHPDMNPLPMDDGNILVRYGHDTGNIVLSEIAKAHRAEIEAKHLQGLTTGEVLITPLGPNKFDDFGKQALLGRAYMFLDAQAPEVVAIHRRG